MKRTFNKHVAPITSPYTAQSITTGQVKTPCLRECGGLLINAISAGSSPKPKAGGELVNCKRILSTGNTEEINKTDHVDPQNTQRTEREDTLPRTIHESKTNYKKNDFGNVCSQEMENKPLDVAEYAAALSNSSTNGVKVTLELLLLNGRGYRQKGPTHLSRPNRKHL